MVSYRSAIIQRHQRAQDRRKAQMRSEAALLAASVASRFPIRRLYLHGSVVDARPLSAWSDLDFVVEGLPPDQLLALAGALAAGAHHPVDIKPFEELPEDQRRRVACRGVLLYERG